MNFSQYISTHGYDIKNWNRLRQINSTHMKTKIALLLFIALIATGSGSMGLPVAILVLGFGKMFYNANKHVLIKK